MAKRLYLDYASLTPIDPRVIREVKRFSSAKYANPSSWYKEGVAAKKALENGRQRVAAFVGAHPDEVIFTSGGTESNALAIEGAVMAAMANGIARPHVVVSSIEHSSVIETAVRLEKRGVEVTRLGVDTNGLVSPLELKNILKPDTCLVSIMTVNNEIGTIEPISELAKAIRNYRKTQKDARYPLFHTDSAQAAQLDELDVQKMGVDMLTLDGGKVYGPRGQGALYIKRGTPIEPITVGGGQESGLRSGTENIPAIMGLAMAIDILRNEKAKRKTAKLEKLRRLFVEGLIKIRPDITVNGSSAPNQAPHILNISMPGIDNEFFVMQLDAAGIACSTKSSCLRDLDESYVLKAMGANSQTSIRFSFGRWTKPAHISRTLKVINKLLSR